MPADSRWLNTWGQAETVQETSSPTKRSRMHPHECHVEVWVKQFLPSMKPSFLATILLPITLVGMLAAQSGRRDLFNGRNLDGWEHVGPGSFGVEDGLLKTRGGMGLLWYTRQKFQHCMVRVVFRLTGKDADSGLFIRIPEKPTEPWMPVNRGYEAEIGDWPDEYSRAGVLYSFTRTQSYPLKPLGEWNTMDVTIDGRRTVIYVNGVKITDFREGDAVPPKQASSDPERGPRPDSGYIGLQNEPGPEVDFKEVSVVPLKK